MISFPASPTVGQLSSQNGRSYSWTGYAWEIVASVASHAATHGVAGGDAVTVAASQISGGAMPANAKLTLSDGTYDSEVGGWGFGVELSANHATNASLAPAGLTVQASGSSMTVTSAGLGFPDASTQTTAFTGKIAAASVTGLATVATSGSYTDLASKPTIPAATTSASDLVAGSLADARLSANVVLTGDSRLSNSRTPLAHAASHTTGGSDEITAGNIGAAAASHTHNAADISAGTLSDSRLSAAVATYAGVGLRDHSPSAGVDVYPRGEATTPAGNGGVLGTVYWTFFTPAVTVTVSAITMATGTTAATGVTLARMGLYTFDETTATLVARTAAETASTLFAAIITSYLRVFSTAGGYPASYTLLAGQRYGIADVQVGGTVGAFVAGNALSVPVSLMTPRMNGVLAGQTDLPATTSALTTAQAHHFSRLT